MPRRQITRQRKKKRKYCGGGLHKGQSRKTKTPCVEPQPPIGTPKKLRCGLDGIKHQMTAEKRQQTESRKVRTSKPIDKNEKKMSSYYN